jgi:hypothetical protein
VRDVQRRHHSTVAARATKIYDEVMGATQRKPRMVAMSITTQARTIDEFVATFHRLCDADSCFIPTTEPQPLGATLAVSIRLADAAPVLEGLCEVVEIMTTADHRFGRAGMRLAFRTMAPASTRILELLTEARTIARDAAPVEIISEDATVPSRSPILTLIYGSEPLVKPRRTAKRPAEPRATRSSAHRMRMRALTGPVPSRE